MKSEWFKSSRSQGANTDCVEARFLGENRHFRDSKNPAGPVLSFSRKEYREFVAGVKRKYK